MTFYYFAYGSNMLTTRLERRCRGAFPVGRADAVDHAIEFSKLSKDKSGKATLRHTNGGRTPGVVFKIPITELGRLDKCEGVGQGYERCDAFPFVSLMMTKSSRRKPILQRRQTVASSPMTGISRS